MEVEVLSRKLVTPSSPTPQNLRHFQLSSLDQLLPPVYTGLILYYLADEDDVGVADKVAERKRKLEDSLARVLNLYYPLAGRYLIDKFTVDCNDEGVELLETKVRCKLFQVLRGEFDARELNHLVCFQSESTSNALLVIQLNVFDCGGIAIGMAFSHRLVDGCTMSQFINQWAIASCKGIGKLNCPICHLSSLFPARDKLPEFSPVQRMKDRDKIAMRRFAFNKEAIESLKAMARNSNANKTGLDGSQFSRVEVVTAMIWKSLIRANQARQGESLRPSMLTHVVNLRGRTHFPIPENSFGNLTMLAIAKFIPAQGYRTVEYPCLVHLLHNAIRNTIVDCAELASGDDLFMKVTEAIREAGEESEKLDSYVFTSWCRFMFYEANFGWGNPIWMSRFHMPVELISLLDTKDGDGIEAWLNLEESTMHLVQQDPDILAFTSQVYS